MTQVIYVDVLIAVNLFINYFILTAVTKFLYIKTSKKRVILGSSLGAVYSLYILLPEQNLFISLIIKLLMSSTIVWVALCGPRSSIYLKALTCFYSMSFIFLGSMFAIWCVFDPRGMYIKNNVVYFNISPSIMVISTVVSYMMIEGINKIVGRQRNDKSFCEVEIKLMDKVFSVKAKVDTGNSLREAFSGLPVVVVCKSTVKGIVPEDLMNIHNMYKEESGFNVLKCDVQSRMRLIPFSSVGGRGILPAFRADYILIKSVDIRREAYIAVCPDDNLKDEFEGLISPELVQ